MGLRFDGVSTGARRAAAETRAAVKGVGDQAERDTKRISLLGPALRRTLQLAALGLTAFAAAGAVAFKKTVDAASNLEEQINKARVVFRGFEKEVIAWSKTTASSIGISQRAALEFAGTFGNMLVPMGFARDEAAKMSMQLVNLAADMASFNNASPEETLEALRAGLAGETEPLRRFGIFLNEARVRQEALNAGLVKGKDDLTAAGKAAAIYRIILKDTSDSQGDFARTSDSVANSQRTFKALLEDTAARIGAAFLPAVRNAMGAMNEWLKDPENQRRLEAWAKTLTDGIGAALRGIAGWVRDNKKQILEFFRATAELAGDAADQVKRIADRADDVTEAAGGWEDAFKIVLSGALALKLAAILGILGGKGGTGKGGIVGLMARLKGMGPIALIAGLGIANKVGDEYRDIARERFQTAGADPATTTPSGTVADPRAGTIGGLTPQSGGGVSFTAGVTKPRQHVIAFVARVAAVYGAPLNINSGFRPGSRVKGTGNPSQHGTGDAADIGPYYGAQLTEIGQAALIAAGMPEALAYKQSRFVGTVNGVNILFNTNVGGNHYNHVHVGLRSLPAAASTSPQRVTPDVTPVETSADTSTADTGGGSSKAKIDSNDLQSARGTARFINTHLESIASPTLRARIRQRALALATLLGDVTDPKEFARVKRNLNALERDFENAVKLTSATKQARATARSIGDAIARMPDDVQRELAPKMAKLNRELGNVTSKGQLDRIKAELQKIREAINAELERMQRDVERAQDTVGRALGKAADKALQILDAKTEQLLRKARIAFGGESLGEGDLGPAGRALRDFRAAREAADRARSRSEALAGAETAEDRAALEAQFALEDQERALEEAAQLEERAIADALERERERIRDERAILRERFQARYDEITRALANEEITAEQAQDRLLALLQDPQWAADFAAAGELIGAAFAASFNTALLDVAAAVRELRDAINAHADAAGIPRPGETAAERALRIRSEELNQRYGLGTAARYVSASSAILSQGRTAAASSAVLAGARPVLAIFQLDKQEVARALAQPMTDEQARIIGYESRRA